jgi:rRNA maturation protein Rpf1
MILATDMADHMSHSNYVEFKIKNKQISREMNNGHLFVEAETEKEKFAA